MIALWILIFSLSTLFSMFGKGGGEFYLPIITTFLSVKFYTAAGISQFMIAVQGLSMMSVYSSRNKSLDWVLGILLVIMAGTGSFLGGFFSVSIPAIYLKLIFAGFLFLSAFLMLVNKKLSPFSLRYGKWHRKFYGGEYTFNLPLVVLPVFLAGFLSGMIGISGGSLIVPACVLLGGIPLKIAMGTNTVVVFASTSMGFIAHALRGGIDWHLALFLSSAVLFGAQVGSHLHAKIDEKKLRLGFVALLLFASAWMVAKMFVGA